MSIITAYVKQFIMLLQKHNWEETDNVEKMWMSRIQAKQKRDNLISFAAVRKFIEPQNTRRWDDQSP